MESTFANVAKNPHEGDELIFTGAKLSFTVRHVNWNSSFQYVTAERIKWSRHGDNYSSFSSMQAIPMPVWEDLVMLSCTVNRRAS